MRKLLLTFSIFLSVVAQGQNQDFFSNNWSADSISTFGIHGLVNFQSQSLNSTIAGIFIYGGEIDQEIKDKNLQAHQSTNDIEGNVFGQINYQSKNYKIGNLGFSYGLQIEQDYSAYTTYTKDFFQLAFYGNSNLESADLSNSKVIYWDVQKFGIPLTLQFADSARNKITEFGIQPTLYLGKNYFELQTKEFIMTTATDGSSITFEGRLNALISDTSNVNYAGIGGGINAHVYQKINRLELRLSGRNIGLINWQNSLNAKFDERRTYEGITVEDIFNVSDSISTQGFVEDSLISWSEKNNTQWLPASFEASARYQIIKNNFIIGSIRYVGTKGFIPQTEIGYAHQGKLLQYGVAAGYGGMTNMLFGGYFGVTFLGFNSQIYTHSFLGGIDYDVPGLATNVGLRLQYTY